MVVMDMIKYLRELKKQKMNNSYNVFSILYDDLTENVNYKVRSDYISDFFIKHGIDKGNILDLACGTGSFTKEFLNKGYSLTGVDFSEDMLTVAQTKLKGNYKLIKASMVDYVNENEYDGIICCLDSINHLTELSDVQKTFNNCYLNLKENGLFVFDVNTIYKHQEILANNTFVFDNDDYYLVWDNEAVDEREIRILIDIFLFNGESYDRYSEEFNEYAYSIDELVTMLSNAGFSKVSIYDELSLDKYREDSERLYFVCEK